MDDLHSGWKRGQTTSVRGLCLQLQCPSVWWLIRNYVSQGWQWGQFFVRDLGDVSDCIFRKFVGELTLFAHLLLSLLNGAWSWKTGSLQTLGIIWHRRVGLPLRGTLASWMNGPARTLWCSGEGGLKSCTWDTKFPQNNTRWALTGQLQIWIKKGGCLDSQQVWWWRLTTHKTLSAKVSNQAEESDYFPILGIRRLYLKYSV